MKTKRIGWPPAVLLCSCLLISGCLGLGYQVGAKSLFGQDIETVYVPVFESDDMRRDLAERLTEAVCKRIESRTSYKVVGRPTADSVLEGRIVSRKKSTTIVDTWSDPQQIMGELHVEIKWRDRRDRDLTHSDSIPWNDGTGNISSTSYMMAEYGHSELTMEQTVVDQIADKIVGMMEMPW